MRCAATSRSFRHASGSRAGFTLAELVVAVGAALLLTLGVGQVFQSVGNIVSQGAAIAEVDQHARSIERQLRDDFQSLSNMQVDETFVAIRNRIVTDVYFSRDELEADVREQTVGTAFSRVIPETRLDEIMFIGQSNEDAFISYERDPLSNNIVTSRFARIYYGHGLRPVPEPQDLAPNTPFVRIPDGDFGSPRDSGDTENIYGVGTATYLRVLDDGSFVPGSVETTDISDEERNRFAGEWPLARQVLLLHDAGGQIMGRALVGGAGGSNSLIGVEREYAPYVRDLETEYRFGITDTQPDPGPSDVAFSAPLPIVPQQVSNPRLIRHGRTDICAQSLDEMIQWLEGLQLPFNNSPLGSSDATAWNSGAWDVAPSTIRARSPNDTTPSRRDEVLWDRFPGATPANLEANFRELQSAIAGMFARPVVETEPPDVDRKIPLTGVAVSSTGPEDSLMDLHATLAPRCSRFEIAWSDDRVWDDVSQPISTITQADNFFRDDTEAILPRDRLWYDYNFTRRDLWQIAPRYDLYLNAPFSQDPEILPEEAPSSSSMVPAVFRTSWSGVTGVSGERGVRLNLDANAASNSRNAYDPLRTGGSVGEDPIAENDDEEYLAIFPFQQLSEEFGGDYGEPFHKPRLIRIRMTLHDSQLVLREGKSYQFVLRVNPR